MGRRRHARDRGPRRRRHHRPRRRPDAGRQHPGARAQGAARQRGPQRGPGRRLRPGRDRPQARLDHRRHLPHAHPGGVARVQRALHRSPPGRGREGCAQARARPHVPVRASHRRAPVHAERCPDREDRADGRRYMSFKILLLGPDIDESWPQKIRQAVPGTAVTACRDPRDALVEIEDAGAAYGTVPPELLARAKKLRWICAARAGLGGDWFYDALVKSDVIVTNMRGSYNEHLSTHAVAFLLAFARRFEHYLPQKQWQRGPGMIDLPAQTVLIVGVGGAGSEASKLCAAFGMRVLGADPRVTDTPTGMDSLFTPDRLEERLGEADFVIVTTPETPDTLGMFDARLFSRMKRGAYFINISRGGCVVTADLIAALRAGQPAG